MRLHITRAIAATLNLLLGGLMTYVWVLMAQERGSGSELKDFADWLLMAAMVAGTVASVVAGALLLRRRTLSDGLRWHHAVTVCWLVLSLAFVLDSRLHEGAGVINLLLAATVAVLSLPWPLLGFLMRRQMNRDPSVTIAAPLLAALPLESSETAHTPALTTTRPVTLAAPEAAPIRLARRG